MKTRSTNYIYLQTLYPCSTSAPNHNKLRPLSCCSSETKMKTFHFLEQIVQIPPFFIPLILFVIFLHKWLSMNPNSSTQTNLPPSPPKLPIIGNLHQVGKHPHRNFQALSKRYGDLMLLQLGSMPTLIISSSKSASLALKTFELSFSGRPGYALAKSVFYGKKDVIFRPYGDHWRHMRSICVLQLLSNKRVRSFRRVREEEVALMDSNIRKSSIVNLSEMLALITSNVLCRVAFGRKCNKERDGVNFGNMVQELAGLFGSNNVEDVLPMMAWVNWVTGFNVKVKKLCGLFDKLIDKIIAEHVNRVKGATQDVTMTDFVDILLEAQREGTSKDNTFIDNDSIKGVILDMLAGGTHTSAVLMEWLFTELVRHPRVMGRLQQEVRGIAGDKEMVQEEEIEKMVYLQATIKETFRLHPPLPILIPRECTQDVQLEGYHIAKGTQVIVNAWAIARDPTCWEEPDSFIPERFLNSTKDVRGQDFELIPFGAGRRICPGISFSMVSIEFVVANLIQKFDWGLPVGREKEALDMSQHPGLSAHRRTPLVLAPTPRS